MKITTTIHRNMNTNTLEIEGDTTLMDYQRQQYQQYDERSQQEHRQQTFYEGGYQPAQPPVSEFSPQQPVMSNDPPLSFYPSPTSVEQPAYRYQTFQPFPQTSSDNSKVFAVFAYMVGWLSGLLVLLFAGQNRYIRFHALQSLLFFGAINLIDIFMLASVGWWRFMPFSGFRPFTG